MIHLIQSGSTIAQSSPVIKKDDKAMYAIGSFTPNFPLLC